MEISDGLLTELTIDAHCPEGALVVDQSVYMWILMVS